MVPASSFDEKLRALVRMLNIPVRDRWPELGQEANIYSYWEGIGLLDARLVPDLLAGRGVVEPKRVVRRFFRNVDYYWPPGIYAGRRAADFGSGYGHLTMWLLLSGARAVVSIGDADRIGFIERLYDAAVCEGLLPRGALITRGELLREGERRLLPDRHDAWLSLVVMNDVLEHINLRARRSVFEACFGALQPGGRLISRQHNSDCPRTMARLRQTWEQAERSHCLPARREAIRGLLEAIEPPALEALSLATRGYDSRALAEAVAKFANDASVPRTLPDAAPINIETDEVCEGPTTIATVLAELRMAGFTAYAYPAMRESRRSVLFQPLARAIPRPFFRLHVFDDNTVFVAARGREE